VGRAKPAGNRPLFVIIDAIYIMEKPARNILRSVDSKETAMQTGHNVLKWGIAVISAVIGGSLGLFGGPEGTAAGVVSGLLVGYYYVHFTLKLKSLHAIFRIILGTLYGALAGILCGISVHIPNLFYNQGLLGSDSGAIVIGAGFGVAVGTAFGFVAACVIAFVPAKKESE
jgi:hypothetical protein